ncbi:rhomboid domain-containing protein 2 isoform X2 [Hyla sarda]|uniref:rhomboid domain-containing protein 2 isoform X2 n=1 Tax=Hyla sarda TaxID=327740 RepID=UPI0024C425EB|nr:rhomboid domain-containing protein 2 isoform X2 [Hyla sarda]
MAEERTTRGWWGTVLSWLPDVHLTTGSVLTIVLSLAISVPGLTREAAAGWDLDAGVLGSASFHRLITYIYFHEDLPTLVCSCLLVWYFGGGFEESVGTVKFCLLTPLFAVWSGLLYLVVIATGISLQKDVKVQGFTPVAFSMISVFTIRTNLRRLIFFGFMVPTKAIPLLFLIPALFIPHATILSNICAILVGVTFGMGGCFFLDLSELLLTRVDQMVPFKALKRIPIWRYIPASSVERNASQTRQLNPPPGSYPVQQYYTPPQGLPDVYSPYHHMKSSETWPPASASVYPTGAASGQPYSYNPTGEHAHSHNVNYSLARTDFHSPEDLSISSDQPELLQVQTR